MTECERIIGKGVFDESFLKEEIRCGFKVTTERKALWMVLLDILIEFDKVCRKHNLRYVLDSGSLLGAVRHKGFIPWDDDIDVAMPREDYDRFIQLAGEFENPYLLQYPTEGSDYVYSFAKVRNVNTTFASRAFLYNKFNQGCFIDIFPYDEFDVDQSEMLYDAIKPLVIALSVSMKLSNPQYKCEDIDSLEILKHNTSLEIFRKADYIARSAKCSGSGHMASLMVPMTHFRKKAYRKEWVYDTELVTFEGLEFVAPKHSHEMLSLVFGDYMQFPPINKRGVEHSGAFCFPGIPYEDFKCKQDPEALFLID